MKCIIVPILVQFTLSVSSCIHLKPTNQVPYAILYNNTPSKAIVNGASNITYRPLIEADDSCR